MCRALSHLMLTTLILVVAGGVGAGEVAKGKVLFEWWDNIGSGTAITDLTNNARYPNSPTSSAWLDKWEGPLNRADNYGDRARAYLIPPADGAYTFYIASDDAGELWLSMDDNPANAMLIAKVAGWTNPDQWASPSERNNQKSAAITLKGGKRYFMQTLHKEGGGGDNIGVGWTGSVIGTTITAIDGKYCTAFIRNPEPLFKARNPTPANEAVEITDPLFTWTAGVTAVQHKVYVGTSATLTAKDFMMTMPSAMYFHMAYLTPGAKYYWRVDEVDAAWTTFTGDVWSFTVQPLEAHNPDPTDGMAGRTLNVSLKWVSGQGAAKHRVFLGTEKAKVTAGDASVLVATQAGLTFAPTGLAPSTTYYWRIDEVDSTGKVTAGPVWSFGTIDAGPANKIKYEWWLNISGTNIAALTSNPKYPASPDGSNLVARFQSPVDWADNYGQRLSGWLKPPQTGDYTFWIAGDDEQQLWLSTDDSPTNVKMIANVAGWTPAFDWDNTGGGAGGPSQKSPPIKLEAGKKYFIMALGKEGGGGDSTAVAWQGPGLTARQVIDAKYVDQFDQQPGHAFGPSPADGARDVVLSPTLTWNAGAGALTHRVYFGSDKAAVNAGDFSVDKGILAVTSFQPGALAPGQTYYWRIDEVQANGVVVKGPTWVFACSMVGPLEVIVDGYVRDILNGDLISTDNGIWYHNIIFEPNCSGYPHKDDDIYPYLLPPRSRGYYLIQLLLLDEKKERGYDVTIQGEDHKTDYVRVVDPKASHPRFQFATMETGIRRNTRRDFILWPASEPEPDPGYRPIYRFRSPDQSRYFFTTDELEMDNLLYDDYPDVGDDWRDPRDPNDWVYNGIAFWAHDLNAGSDLTPVYRLQSDKTNVPAYSTCEKGTDLDPNQKWTSSGKVLLVHPPDNKPTGEKNVIGIRRFWSKSLQCYAYVREGDQGPVGWDWKDENIIVWWAHSRPGQ